MPSTTRVALITGAGSGMGQLAAWRLAAAGAKVAALDLNEEGLATTAARAPDVIRALPCDVTDTAAVEHAVKTVEAEVGSIDRVMNAAGIARVGPILDQDPALIMTMMAVNYGGIVNLCSATMPLMLERGRGELVNFASLLGWFPSAKIATYSATKHAVVAYTEGLWLENRGHGVKIMCLCPPAVKTAMLPDFFPSALGQKRSMPIGPEKVIDAIEAGFERDQFLVFPDASAKVMWRLRRFTPGLLRRITGMRRFDFVGG